MKYFIIKNQDGTVQVMQMLRQPPDYHDSSYSTPEAEIAKWAPYKQKEVQSWREIDVDGIPNDRTFREAWCDETPEPKIDINMPKARDIHRNRLRDMRADKLTKLDIEMSRAFNDPAKQGEIEKRRQALRDVTADPAIEKASTPEELMAVIPGALK